MQLTSRRLRLALTSVSLLALASACGSSEDGSTGTLPPFSGGPQAPGTPTPADPNSPPPTNQPTDPGAVPGDPNGTPEAPGDDLPLDNNPPPATSGEGNPVTENPPPGETPPGETPVEEPPAPATIPRPSAGTVNLFTELLGIPPGEVDAKVTLAANRIFGIGTNEPTQPPATDSGYRVYYELPQDPTRAYIWAVDSNDIRSEGMSYGMMIAVQLGMQQQFDRLWNFARQFMQFPANSNITAWRGYFRWQGSVNTGNANNWQVNYGADTGPAPDGDEYFAASLYLANRRWGSGGAINYLQEANTISNALINNAGAGGRTPLIDGGSNMVVFFPNGNSAGFSDPSYHLPAFYEIFAQDGPQNNAARWRQIANTSRQYFVSSANAQTGLHPDYANFNGTPNNGGSDHDDFRYDAWRVVMNMAIDYSWGSQDQRLKTQIEKYHSFFGAYLGENNVTNSLFELNGSGASGGSSTALTSTLASGALVSAAANRADYVENLWEVGQQSGLYRYYQETVYMLGLLSVAGLFGYQWDQPQ